jgi:signal transduction histidine kinase
MQEREMQSLAKVPTRISKFVPHTQVSQRTQPRSRLPVLKEEHFDQLAHDARNVLSAMRLYCELLAEPGVLTEANSHYAQELQAVSNTASQLMERLAAPRRTGLRRNAVSRMAQGLAEKRKAGLRVHMANDTFRPVAPAELAGPQNVVTDLGAELRNMQPLLTAIAGPRIRLEIDTLPCEGRTRLSSEDLSRVMLNLVRNASEAMPGGGKVRISSQYGDGLSFLDIRLVPDTLPRSVAITVEDSGPGIPEDLREEIFRAGFTTHTAIPEWPATRHLGLGLSIVRDLIEAAGGTARVGSSPAGRTRFELELPVTSGMYEMTGQSGLVADSVAKGCIECP